MDRITDRPDMTSAVDRRRKASTQTLFLHGAKHCHQVFAGNIDML